VSRRHKPFAVVFDCMVFLQAVANEESVAAQAVDLMETGEVQLFVSVETLKEIRDVLNRPKIRARFRTITDTRVEGLFQRLDLRAIFVPNVPQAFEYARDPKDEPYINLAVAVGADYIVSRDNDLLDLMTGHSLECKEFRQRFRSLRVIEPLDLLEQIKVSKEAK